MFTAHCKHEHKAADRHLAKPAEMDEVLNTDTSQGSLAR